jgi:hypothetical protein
MFKLRFNSYLTVTVTVTVKNQIRYGLTLTTAASNLSQCVSTCTLCYVKIWCTYIYLRVSAHGMCVCVYIVFVYHVRACVYVCMYKYVCINMYV